MADDKQLEDIRDSFQYFTESWRENYRAGDEDMRYVAGDPWPSEERKARESQGRPCLSLDELGQYLNQRINDIRQNKRAVKLAPQGQGADEQTAELRADIIRTIEAKGGMQAYICGYENALMRGFGFWAVSKRYVAEDSFDQELYIRIIPNPKTVYVDPDAKEPSCSDMRRAFILEDVQKDQFAKRWASAEMKDFPAEYITRYPLWFKEKTVQVCEAWSVDVTKETLLLVGDEANPQVLWEKDIPKGAVIEEGAIRTPGGALRILKDRESERRSVVQRITNGVEILETNEWEGRWIPIIPVWGRGYWIDTGAGSKRVIESFIRKARDAQMLHNYIMTAKMEAIGQVLRAPYIGYEGQIDGHENEWKFANKSPHAILLVKPVMDATGNSVLPLPQRNFNNPEIQGYEIADESAKRSIQNSLGMFSSANVKADQSAKSGVALRTMELASDQGNFHFVDNFDVAIQHTGRICDDMIPHVYDTARDLLLRKPDETHKNLRVNEPIMEDGKQVIHDTTKGRHEPSVSTGPSFQSQREMAEKTADLLLESQVFAPRIADLAVKMKGLGPLGDQIAERLTPPEFQKKDENDAAQNQQKLQQATQMVQALTQQVNALTQEKETKAAELASREKIAASEQANQIELEKLKIEADLAKAEISTKAQNLAERVAFVEDMLKQLQIHQHEAGMKAMDLQAAADQAVNAVNAGNGGQPQP